MNFKVHCESGNTKRMNYIFAVAVFFSILTIINAGGDSFVANSTVAPTDDETFDAFKLKFHKSYATPELERQAKIILLQKQAKIDEHNLRYDQGLESFSMKLWEFSDMPFKDLNGHQRRNTKFAGTGEIRAFEDPATEEELKSSIDNHARIHATMDTADDNFLSYKSGVYKCKSPELKLQLKVLIIGYGTENNIDYWLCKNSWGTSFGEFGTFKITRRNSPCLIKPNVILK